MKVFRLDSAHNPSDTLLHFDTLVWSERYQTNGDFQLVVEDDISILSTLPVGCLISHTDTYEVMLVEEHEIKRDAKKKLIVTVTGRSFETFGENRPTIGSAQPLYDGSGDAIVETITNSAEDVVQKMYVDRMVTPALEAEDDVPGVAVTQALREEDVDMTHIVKRGHIYERALEFLKLSGSGIRTSRPHGAQTTLNIVVHDGLDLTESVIFYAQYEDLEDATYFWSIRNYRNYAEVAGNTYFRRVRHRDLGSALSGLDRRVMYVDANDIEGTIANTGSDVIYARGQSEMDDHKKIALLQAKISTTARPKFKVHYDVGDLVRVFGEFATAQTMRVTEHILTVDKKGMRGYPSLSIA